ncbi:UDP-glucose:(heptosyl)LPS alpha-1,3-glucosyltransferase [Polaromonas sp. YR568]|uniref:glycosyltransferase family 4 protein n=1 Tax=Polaromonas sp. YR568 TaxID=1855301 RepID=UPI0008E8E217|nr:glycosyltransferase family 4 protein [Polaromonas sp. YR568]SFU49059.1 UDP-glucose:(heptosyl)LPS alpha-1,3-glucosyltransferase [Polaromonas sp. YR568]
MSLPDSPAKKLRVAVFNRTFSPTGGGAERYSIALVEQLSARHEMHVFAQEIDHQWPGVTYHKVSAPLRKPRWINQLWFATATWWATRRGFDVVHSHENTWHGEVQTVHVMPVKYNLFQGRHGARRVLRWIKVVTSPRLLAYLGLERARYAARPGRQVVVTSESLRPIMAGSYPDSRAVTSVVTPGITMPPPVSASRKREARAQLRLPAEGTCLLFVGNDYRKKGLEALLQAMAQLPAGVMLAVVGNSAHIAEFRGVAEALKLGARVFFLGALKDVAPAYEAADILVHPTFEDTFAMVVLEAMAHGLPVVVSGPKYCGISGLLRQGVNALMLDDPRDAGELTRVLGDLLGRAGLRETLSEGAVAFATHYQWREIALQQETLYFSAIAAKAGSERR